jgi:CRISPR-associated protein Cas1
VRALYVTQDGATVRREGGVLQVFVQRAKVADVPVRDLEQLVLMGNIMLTPGALDLIVEAGVDAVFLTHHGRYRARLVHGLSANVRLRLAQYRRLLDPAGALALARAIVAGKVANCRTLLQRHARRHGDDARLEAGVRSLQAAEARLELAESLDEVRGCEGAGAAAYFRAFAALVRAPGFSFHGRNRRPPLDPVNALLSLGYTLLANAVEAAVQVVGLDPYLGALHAPQSGRPSLVCDLEEELRAPLVDALVLAVVNKGVLVPGDFEDVGPGEPVVVKRDAVRSFVRAFEERLDQAVLYGPQEVQLPWRLVLEQQARACARFVSGEAPAYVPFAAR